MAKRQAKQQLPELVRRDGALCATFVNSAREKRRGFASYAELVAWSVTQGTLSDDQARRLEGLAADRPADAAGIVDRALALRDGLRRILQGLAARQGPPADALVFLNAEVAAVLPIRRLIPVGKGCRWAWGDRDGDDLDRMLWPLVLSAADVLSTKDHRRVRQCAGEDCGLVFIDRTPGSPRKWCSMSACGNRVKALRHYRRVVKPRRNRRQAQRARSRRSQQQVWPRSPEGSEDPPA